MEHLKKCKTEMWIKPKRKWKKPKLLQNDTNIK